MRRFLLPLCIALCAATSGRAQSAPDSPLLRGMQDRSRPLLLFAGASDPRVAQQYGVLATNASGLQDRQIRIVLVTTTPTSELPSPPAGTVAATPPEQQALRARFHVPANTFTVILVGKDGGEKFRSTTPVSFATLTHVIDAMPMRQQEMHPR